MEMRLESKRHFVLWRYEVLRQCCSSKQSKSLGGRYRVGAKVNKTNNGGSAQSPPAAGRPQARGLGGEISQVHTYEVRSQYGVEFTGLIQKQLALLHVSDSMVLYDFQGLQGLSLRQHRRIVYYVPTS